MFIDEIDKIARRQETVGADVSREGVQRDLLPLVEGCTVNTKYGMVKTDHILFIASGAFHMSKPSDLIPELQGRLPIRVELEALKVEDFVRILTEPDASLCTQYAALLRDRGRDAASSTPDGVRRIAEVAFDVNERTENIGARRLHTVMERLLEAVSFEASDRSGTELVDRRGLRRREPRRAGAGRGPRPLHPVTPRDRPGALGRDARPTEIKLRTQSRVLDVAFDDGAALRAAVRVPARLLAVGRGARARPGPGDAAARQARGAASRAVEPVGNYARAARVRRRPRHRPLHLGLPARARRDARREVAAITSTGSRSSASPTRRRCREHHGSA